MKRPPRVGEYLVTVSGKLHGTCKEFTSVQAAHGTVLESPRGAVPQGTWIGPVRDIHATVANGESSLSVLVPSVTGHGTDAWINIACGQQAYITDNYLSDCEGDKSEEIDAPMQRASGPTGW